MPYSDADTVAWLQKLLSSGEVGELEQTLSRVQNAIESTGAIPYTRALAERHATSAKASVAGLPESAYKTALLQLAEFAVSRKH